jgi:adenine-specific DNA-methyltransferase
MESLDVTAENIAKLAELFPSVVTESLDADGQLQRVIDFDLLRQELADHVVDGPQERYQLDWPGKRASLFVANAPIAKTLRPVVAESVDFATTRNLFIEGDNLEALKLLQQSYLGKIKLIYIDPPYNTGNDLVYRDDFAESSTGYLERSGQIDDDGTRLVANTETNGRFHSDWLSMMYPRLRLARQLLTDDGVMFMSIDDNEAPRLRQLCDEVFGEHNFVATFIWEKRTNRENRRAVSYRHDTVLCYVRARGPERPIAQLPMNAKALANYSNPDNDPRGLWKSDPAIAQAGHATASQFYKLTTPSGREFDPPSGNAWRFTEPRFKEMVSDGRMWFGKDGSGVPRVKTYLYEKERGLTPETILFAAEAGTNESAKNALKELFDGIAVFDTPKPVGLMQVLLQLGSGNDSIVLDFFAGSATFAHATMAQNAADGGSRRFIVVQVGEGLDPASEAAKAGYATVADVAKDRIRRAGIKVLSSDAGPKWNRDVGFRLLRIDGSGLVDTLRTPDETAQTQLSDLTKSVVPDRSSEDLLFQVLVDWGLDLAVSIAVELVEGQQIYTVGDGALIACFEETMTTALVSAIASRQPLRAVFRDSAFRTDADRINAEQVFAQKSPGTEIKVL